MDPYDSPLKSPIRNSKDSFLHSLQEPVRGGGTLETHFRAHLLGSGLSAAAGGALFEEV